MGRQYTVNIHCLELRSASSQVVNWAGSLRWVTGSLSRTRIRMSPGHSRTRTRVKCAVGLKPGLISGWMSTVTVNGYSEWGTVTL